ncbi:MAG: hypothetical protein Q9219_000081 [cf. Caloplaca sp. 3 TL-2023]
MKRKRTTAEEGLDSKTPSGQLHNGQSVSKKARTQPSKEFTLQIIAGTYEKVLHGVTATIKRNDHSKNEEDGVTAVEFADTFLFNAHGSAIQCLSLSPSSKQDKITLASGGSDQTINLYQLSARRPIVREDEEPAIPSLVGRRIVENPTNRELGSLQHHAASITALNFPTRSKLLSAADDNTIAIARTRDWTILSTIKIPIPKAHGRPSGDTAPLGGTPSGVNDFAIHPSMKLMVSVSKGEKCMRLWNLAVGEGRWGRGEGFRVEWDGAGEEFAVSFEKGAVCFGLDSKPKGIIITSPPSKIHRIRYIDLLSSGQPHSNVLAVSTEDGRVVFFSTKLTHRSETVASSDPHPIPTCRALGEIREGIGGSTSRTKDFEVLRVSRDGNPPVSTFIVTGNSEGSIRVWEIELSPKLEQMQSRDDTAKASNGVNNDHKGSDIAQVITQVGWLLGEYQTGNRITCLKAFIMADTATERDTSHLSPNAAADSSNELTSDEHSA